MYKNIIISIRRSLIDGSCIYGAFAKALLKKQKAKSEYLA
jgi:hypothetical protein